MDSNAINQIVCERVVSGLCKTTLSDIMSTQIITTPPETPIENAILIMKDSSIGCLLVTEDDQLCGVFTERDIMTKCFTNLRTILQQPISTVMHAAVTTAPPTMPIRDAVFMFQEHHIRHLPVHDGNNLVGIVSQRDVLALLSQALR